MQTQLVKADIGYDIVDTETGLVIGVLTKSHWHQGWTFRVPGLPWLKDKKTGRVPYPGLVRSKQDGIETAVAVAQGWRMS